MKRINLNFIIDVEKKLGTLKRKHGVELYDIRAVLNEYKNRK